MASLVWTDTLTSSTTKVVLRGVVFNISVVYAEHDDLINKFIAGKWYGTAVYNNATINTTAQIGMTAAKTAILKLISQLDLNPH